MKIFFTYVVFLFLPFTFTAQTTNFISKFITPTTFTNSLIFDNGSNLGIGTNTPSQKLHINNGAILIQGTVPTLGGPQLLFGGIPANQPYGEYGIEYLTSAQVNEVYGGLNFWKPFQSTGLQGNYFLFLSDEGKVGVNTKRPTANLTVFGNLLIGDPNQVALPMGYRLYVQNGILAEKIKVALINTGDWADYVFNDNYNLMSLGNLATFINKNGHLPGVDSSEEIFNNGGYDIVKMDSKLLEKIEELTLYILKLNKELEELKTQNIKKQ